MLDLGLKALRFLGRLAPMLLLHLFVLLVLHQLVGRRAVVSLEVTLQARVVVCAIRVSGRCGGEGREGRTGPFSALVLVDADDLTLF